MTTPTVSLDRVVMWRITHPRVGKTWHDAGTRFEPIAENFAAWIAERHPDVDPWDGLGAEWHLPDVTSDTEGAWQPWEDHPAYQAEANDVGT